MHRTLSRLPLVRGAAAARVAGLADALDARARTYAPLLELHMAHLEHHTPGRSRSAAEHALELVELGLRWRAHAPAPRRDRGAEAGIAELDRLLSRLAALGRPETELSRVRAWRDFARAEDVAEVLGDAAALAAWFEEAARVGLGPDLADAESALALVRAEVMGRALRHRRRPAFVSRPPQPRTASRKTFSPGDTAAGGVRRP
jgi:hypothetical protein